MQLASVPQPEIGKYRLLAELARGGMGIVYLAAARGPAGFSKLLALKELKSELSGDPSFVAMFLDEARTAARLNHPNIVQTNEVGQQGDRSFITMEYLDGRPLQRVERALASQGGLPLAAHLWILREVLSALQYAHDLCDFDGTPLRFVHRDMTPSNIFVTFDGQVKILDFGIAKSHDSSQETKTGVIKGKLSYMSPEQARSQPVDRRSDIFSVGVILWEAVAGRRMWQGKREIEILTHLLSDDIPRLPAVRPDAPAGLVRICERATAPRPEDRYATAEEMQADIENYQGQAGELFSARQLRALLAPAFIKERAQARTLIEAQLAQVRAGSPPVSLPRVPHFVEPSGTTSASSRYAGQVVPTEPAIAKPTLGQALAGVLLHRPRIVFIALGVVAVVTALIVAFSGSYAGPLPAAPGDPHIPGPSAQAAAVIVTPSARPAPREREAVAATADEASVTVVISASPANAHAFIDGVPLEGNPLRVRYPRSPIVHHVRVTAPGHASRERDLSFSQDVVLDLSLERLRGETAAAHRSTTHANVPLVALPVHPAPPPLSVAVTPTHPEVAPPHPEREPDHRRPIQLANPYAED